MSQRQCCSSARGRSMGAERTLALACLLASLLTAQTQTTTLTSGGRKLSRAS